MGPLSAHKDVVDNLVARLLSTLTKGKTFGERCVPFFHGNHFTSCSMSVYSMSFGGDGMLWSDFILPTLPQTSNS